uniref:Uncharacterized protein n=1 Tax=Lactuca sativa TaxID=4236 RepID=A0A9R1VGP0_LACSA|nr:hypothetical protein LSAT_V11C500249230 [Lactuca sativa]
MVKVSTSIFMMPCVTLMMFQPLISLSAEYFKIANRESLALVLHRNLSINAAHVISENDVVDREVQEMAAHMDQQRKLRYGTQNLKLPISNYKLFPFVVQAPILELKTLPEHLKYAYLGDKETLPVIISNKLSEKEEFELIRILKEYKTTIGWTIADINGLSPSLCMHKILMEDDYKPSREAQHRLNSPMMEILVAPEDQGKRLSPAFSGHSRIGVCPLDSATHMLPLKGVWLVSFLSMSKVL